MMLYVLIRDRHCVNVMKILIQYLLVLIGNLLQHVCDVIGIDMTVLREVPAAG